MRAFATARASSSFSSAPTRPSSSRSRSRQARPAAHRRSERRRGEASRSRGGDHSRRDRLRLAGGVAARLHPRGGSRRSSASSPTAGPRRSGWRFCEEHGAEPGESHQDPAGCDVVVTATTSRDPVLRGEWLRAGTLVCAVGANDGRKRELDNVVLERSAFVCCDSLDDAKLESADLIEPIGSGVLDWLEVHELQEVVAGELAGRQSDDDIVVFKSNGLAAWDVAVAAAAVERARAAGVGREVQ